MKQRSIGLPGFTPIGIQGKTMTSFERQIPLLTDEIKQWHRLNHQVVLVLNNQQRREGTERALKVKELPLFIVRNGLQNLIRSLFRKVY